MEDVECQEYAAFALAHIASNRDYQVILVVRPLVAMLSSDAEPRYYAGFALLKLADNFENHLRIAEEGGIQASLRLEKVRSTDEQLQYKAALTVGTAVVVGGGWRLTVGDGKLTTPLMNITMLLEGEK
jgi:hypothetical protein